MQQVTDFRRCEVVIQRTYATAIFRELETSRKHSAEVQVQVDLSLTRTSLRFLCAYPHSARSVFSLFLVFIFSQGDYIKHPVLYELSHKYGLTDNLPESLLPNRLEEIKEAIRREIRKELKIKEGAEKLREVATDRRSLSDVASIVKKSNNKLAELKSELHELESQIILTQGNSVSSNGQGKSRTCLPWCSIFLFFVCPGIDHSIAPDWDEHISKHDTPIFNYWILQHAVRDDDSVNEL